MWNKEVPYIQRSEVPETCECYVIDKEIKGLRRCSRPIDFIAKSSGYFMCVECAQLLKRRYGSQYKHLYILFEPTECLRYIKKALKNNRDSKGAPSGKGKPTKNKAKNFKPKIRKS